MTRHNILSMRPGTKAVLVAILVAALCSVLAAEPISQLKPTGYVNDFAHALDSKTVAQLDDLCQQIDQKAHAQMAVVTVNSLDGIAIEDYAVELFHQWGIGEKATNRGVLILLAVQDHRYRIEVGYGLEPILPDGKVGSFGREAVPSLKQNDFNGAVLIMTSRVAEVIAQDAGIQLTGERAPEPEAQPQPESGISTGGIVLLVIVVLLVLFSPLRRLLFWWLLLGGGGGGSRGGYGGWGGGGGGGFGGFGGGSSGGGGASGSW